jgi:transcriptional regulator with XRE-family HTH domain
MTAAEFLATRQALGLTQAEFAVRLGLTRSTVARMEAGRPISATVAILARLLAKQTGG